MKKSTLLMVLSLVLALTVGLGTTLAYLTDTDADVNVMTLGNVDILQNEQERDENGELQEFTPNKPLYPAVFEGSSIPWAPEDEWVVPGDQAWKVVEDNENVVDKFVTVTNTGKSDAYVRTFFAFESTQDPATQGDYVHAVTNAAANVGSDVMSEVIWLPGTYQIDGSYYQIGYVTYTQPVQPGETTIPSLKQIYMNKAADNDYVATFGDTYEILVLSQAVQTAGFEDVNENGTAADEALNEAFPMDDDYANVPGWFTGWTKDDIGSPGDENPDNNPPIDADEWDGVIPETMPDSMELTLNPVKNQGGTITVKDAKALVYLGKLKDDFIANAEEIAGYDNYYYHWAWDIELAANIDLNNIEIDPIDISYFGAFKGNGYTITNVKVKDGGDGLFAGSASFSDLTLTNVKINAPAENTVGALSGNAGSLNNVTVINAEVVGNKYVGAISGKTSSVNNCTVKRSEVIASDKTVGGMVGYAIGDPGTATAKNNLVEDVKVTGAYNVGGLFGQGQSIVVENNTVKDSVITSTEELPADASSSEARVGEVVARKHSGTYNNNTAVNVTLEEN